MKKILLIASFLLISLNIHTLALEYDGLQKLSLGQFSDLEFTQIVLITASFLLIYAFINKMFWWLVNTFIYSLFPDFVINHINKRINLISSIISIFIFVFILFNI